MAKDKIKVDTSVEKDLDKVWEFWTKPEHIAKWNQATEDWMCSNAENDLQKGGKFVYRMEAKDGSYGFDFSGEYMEVKPKEKLVYALEDGRSAEINFSEEHGKTIITETFEPESENPEDQQKEGWQAILNSFKKYAETQD